MLNRRDFLLGTAIAGAAGALQSLLPASGPQRRGKGSMLNFAAPKLDRVRFGLIGVGARGSGHLGTLMSLEGVDIVAICDNHKPTADRAEAAARKKGQKPAMYTNGDKDYLRMLQRDDIDAVLISTPWDTHVPMSVAAMKSGKHTFVEVPAAVDVDGCWELVETSEATRKYCMMLENVCYGRDELLVLNMVRQGVFGELLHGEAAYIHDLRWQMNEIEHGTGSWRTLEYTKRNGNLYPTHGLGPVAQYMNINRGDRFRTIVSMSSPSRSRALFAEKTYPAGHSRRSLKFVCGDINTSIIQTALGKTIMLQWDEQLPRPYTRHNMIQGTKGVWAGFPNRMVVEGLTPSTDDWVEGKELAPWFEKYDHPLWKRTGEAAVKNGGHGGMDFVMLWRLVYCLRNGIPVDQDVYDAAAWTVVGPLSERSVARRGAAQDIPDFTRGEWKTAAPLGIVS